MLCFITLILAFPFALTEELEATAQAQSLWARTFKATKGDIKFMRSSMKDLIRRTGGFELIKTQMADLIKRVGDLENESKVAAKKGNTIGGGVYTRWGRKTCPSTAKLVYSGVAVSEHYHHYGGGANYLCMPIDKKGPEYDSRQPNFPNYGGFLYGVEYEVSAASTANPFKKLHDEEAPCAVCETKGQRNKVLMIPSKMTCPAGWTKEYGGFLMAEHYTHRNNKQYACVDGNPEFAVASQKTNHNGGLFYFQRYHCGALHCESGKFRQNGVATCAVCSKK